MDFEIDVDYNTLILRPEFDSDLLGTEWFNQEPWFVNGGPGRVVIHTGGRGLIRVTVAATGGAAPPITDSLLDEWEDIGEASFTTEDDEICFDGLLGSIIGPMDTAGPGSYRIRVLARGRTEYWDSYPPKSAQPWIHLQLQIWQHDPAPRKLIQYRDRFTGDVVRPAGGVV
ncbi:hypothetical protein FND50_18750 [Rhodococcus sp. WB9]|uniref:hypothetical protein n=1 Tax=Rhodococcus sp. WB9 TaxID=2594007 RepID=UPI00118694F9|nr:hypothetical protein [Rhodococcus sp. WB9]QDQ92632.1 hypothetical protein FND50_18750 [Rhodococcus sp. WB9]